MTNKIKQLQIEKLVKKFMKLKPEEKEFIAGYITAKIQDKKAG